MIIEADVGGYLILIAGFALYSIHIAQLNYQSILSLMWFANWKTVHMFRVGQSFMQLVTESAMVCLCRKSVEPICGQTSSFMPAKSVQWLTHSHFDTCAEWRDNHWRVRHPARKQ